LKTKLLLAAIFLAVPLELFPATSKRKSLPKQELHCLAQNIYHEARGEPRRGQLAVALVTLNRKKHKNYPNSICKVVYQPYQFSWTKVKSKHKVKIPLEYYQTASQALQIKDFTFNAIYFHNTTIKPNWKARRIAKIGNHVFYAA
jgi:spore germination cell wall hydrolase CwlJ-like protein